MKRIVTLCVLAAATLSSCSVAMAAKKSGTDVSTMQASRTRGQVVATGAQLVSSAKDASGNLIEIYKVQEPKGSIARAFMHGFLDISTGGLWEAVGTPIEGSYEKKFYSIKVTYDQDENVKSMELM